jgi:hypothetical protein
MPIKLPNLDDRTFADLLAEAHTLIPVHAPEWTNHNESDPGITLVELFAYLTEMQIYRLNRVTDANVCAFLKLIDGVQREPSTESAGVVLRGKEKKEVALRDEVRDVVLNLRQQDRAVTCEDFERLALAAKPRVTRAYCVPRRDLSKDSPAERQATADAHMSVVIVPAEVLFDTILWFDGKDFNDVTSAGAADGTTISLKPPAGPADARLYLGSSSIFKSLSFALAEAGAGYTLAFEYFDGKNWVGLTKDKHQLSDNTANLIASGLVTFKSPADWKPVDVNGVNGYWLRISTSTVPGKSAAARGIFREISSIDFDDLIAKVSEYLEPRRLLTSRVHVVRPRLVTVGVHVTLALKPDAVPDTVKRDALSKLGQFLNQQTWPFGRDVYVSEIYRLLDRIDGVDFVTRIRAPDPASAKTIGRPRATEPQVPVKGVEILTTDDGDARSIRQGTELELVAIRLDPDELVNFSLAKSEIVPLPPAQEKIES